MISSDSVKHISEALNKAQSEMGVVIKDSNNPYYKSKYADINSVIKTIKDVLNRNGITYLQPLKVKEVAGEKTTVVETVLLHVSGEFISSETEVIQKDKGDPQKYGMSITYSRRFGLQSMVGLPAEDDDGNTASDKTPKKSSDSLDINVDEVKPSPSSFRRKKKEDSDGF